MVMPPYLQISHRRLPGLCDLVNKNFSVSFLVLKPDCNCAFVLIVRDVLLVGYPGKRDPQECYGEGKLN
jgi:hypothetical protein